MTDPPRVVVAQIGSREHYQIPLMLAKRGALAAFHTDYFEVVPHALRPIVERWGGRMGRRALGRRAPGLARNNVFESPLLATLWWHMRIRLARSRATQSYNNAAQGRWFARDTTLRVLRRTSFDTFFGFSSASLEALRFSNNEGKLSVLDVTAPGRVEERIVHEERQRFPHWEHPLDRKSEEWWSREQEEWAAAQRILVNSTWSRDALATEGVDVNKIHVVPLAYQSNAKDVRPKEYTAERPLRVLWLGTLCLRKGLFYAIEAARLLRGRSVSFTFAGPTAVAPDVMDLPSNATYVGQIPRIETGKLWAGHDVFLLPTLSDGFAITQLEAIAHGLPVIATTRCGEVVEPEVSGLLVQPYSATDIVAAIERFLDEPPLLAHLSQGSLARSVHFRPDVVADKLLGVVTP